jgi:cytochrome c5
VELIVRTICALSFTCAAWICIASNGHAQGNESAAQRVKHIYDTYCYVCHGTGWQGAPLTGNAAEWQPRVANGWDTVLKNTRNGLNGMPPKGTCEECTDADFRAVIEMMSKDQ